MNNVFDEVGNFKFCRNCISKVLYVDKKRLSSLHEQKQKMTSDSLLEMTEEEVVAENRQEVIVDEINGVYTERSWSPEQSLWSSR